jgi:sugar phosphate isomerase/epimerase
MTKELGLKYINLKDMHLSLKSTKEERQAALKKVTDAGLVMAGGGVIGIKNDAAQVRNVFEYSRDAGMPVIVCSPEPEALDLVEQHVKEFNLKIAIHNHGPTDKKYPAPQDALKLIKNRDERMGLCIDVGHTFRIKVDPAAAIRECAARVYDIHLKDVTEDNAKGKATIIGDGVLPIPAVLKALLDIKFTGHVGLEYEVAGDDKAPMEGMKRSLAHIRKCLAEMA